MPALSWLMNLGFAGSGVADAEPEAEAAPAASTATGVGGGMAGSLVVVPTEPSRAHTIDPEPVVALFTALVVVHVEPHRVILEAVAPEARGFAGAVVAHGVAQVAAVPAAARLYLKRPVAYAETIDHHTKDELAALRRRIRDLEDRHLLGLP